MFMLSMGSGMVLGFPDVCLTPAVVPVPVPYPNISMSAMAPEAVPTVLTDCMPTLNELSDICASNGDEAGALGGVVSHLIAGQTMWVLGSEAILVAGLPAQRLTSLAGCNAMEVLPNAPGVCLAPSQVTVLALG